VTIYYLDHDPIRCAAFHTDTHVYKMPFEGLRILRAANLLYLQTESHDQPLFLNNDIRRRFLRDAKNRCVKWAASSSANYRWLTAYCTSLGEEYASRTRWMKVHRIRQLHIEMAYGAANALHGGPFTPPPLPTGDDNWANPAAAIAAHRAYYNATKRHLFVWTGLKPPEWALPRMIFVPRRKRKPKPQGVPDVQLPTSS